MSKFCGLIGALAFTIGSNAAAQDMSQKQIGLACAAQAGALVAGGSAGPSVKGEGPFRNLALLLTPATTTTPHLFNVSGEEIHDPTGVLIGSKVTSFEIQSAKNAIAYFLSKADKPFGALVVTASQDSKPSQSLFIMLYADKAVGTPLKFLTGQCAVTMGPNAKNMFEAVSKLADSEAPK